MKKLAAVFLLVIFSISAQAKTTKPKNIILLVGDGMGLSQITYGILNNPAVSNFTRFKNIGLSISK